MNTYNTTSAKMPCMSAKGLIIHIIFNIAVPQTQVPKLCTALDLSLLYILIFETYCEFARKNHFLALGVCFPQPCSSALPRQDHVYKSTDESFRFHSKNVDEIRYKLESTENLRSFEKYPTPP